MSLSMRLHQELKRLVPTAIIHLRALVYDGSSDLHATLLDAQYALSPSGNTISVPFRLIKPFASLFSSCISEPMHL